MDGTDGMKTLTVTYASELETDLEVVRAAGDRLCREGLVKGYAYLGVVRWVEVLKERNEKMREVLGKALASRRELKRLLKEMVADRDVCKAFAEEYRRQAHVLHRRLERYEVRKIRRAYVAGPIRARGRDGSKLTGAAGAAAVLANITQAERVAAWLWEYCGIAAMCVHTISRYIDAEAPEAVWLEGDLALVRVSDLVVLCPGWERSSGTRAEIEEAARWGIPVKTVGEIALEYGVALPVLLATEGSEKAVAA